MNTPFPSPGASLLRVLDDDGGLLPGNGPPGGSAPEGSGAASDSPSSPTGQAEALLRGMLRARLIDDLLGEQFRAGAIGHVTSQRGEEAVSVGAAAALRGEDWVFPARHELGLLLWRGVSVQALLDEAFGNARASHKGRMLPGQGGAAAARVVVTSPILGNHLGHAVGCGWAAKIKGEGAVAVACFGEGAAQSAEFHSALNFAGVFRAPVLFLGRSTEDQPVYGVDPGEGVPLAGRAVAYGLAAERCDGADVLAVGLAVRRALERARRGEGATLVECVISPTRDPIALLGKHLEAVAGQAHLQAIEAAVRGEVAAEWSAALGRAQEASGPAIDSIFDDVYATLPWHLVEQRDSLRASRAG
jgi:TPP-dependent pyruvate/acetoin dehydrogenase alpha subunit